MKSFKTQRQETGHRAFYEITVSIYNSTPAIYERSTNNTAPRCVPGEYNKYDTPREARE